ncbi:MAG TPA: efflux RND transporter periplasmic adaptor subunit [Candidatus Saccharimonadales bacterium]|nr:efflux RND transporter periplasmic adaptor subunit [Candidatus Saccharimonadales bacterium]
MANPKKKSRRRWLILSVLVVIAVAGSGYAWFRKKEVPINVTVEKAARRTLTELVVANGKVQPVLQVVINPEVSGEITELPVKEGQHVKKGDLLLKIKPENYQAARNSAEASYKSALAAKSLAEANMRKEEIEYKRAKELAASKLISESQLLEALTTWEVGKANVEASLHQVEQAAATLAKADDDLSKTTIYAPMAGTVTRLRSQKGERVVGTALMAGTEIMTVADLSEMEARVDIGEVDVVLMALGQVARLEVEAFRDRKFKGIVTEIANSSKMGAQASSSSSSSSGGSSQEATKFEVKIRIQEKEVFRPGMSVTADIETRYRTNVVTVPIQSVTTRLPKKPEDKSKPGEKVKPPAANSKEAKEAQKPIEVVFVVEGDHVKMVPVKRGISDDSYVEITEGLSEGMEVISGGYKSINRELEEAKKINVRDTLDEKKPTDSKS